MHCQFWLVFERSFPHQTAIAFIGFRWKRDAASLRGDFLIRQISLLILLIFCGSLHLSLRLPCCLFFNCEEKIPLISWLFSLPKYACEPGCLVDCLIARAQEAHLHSDSSMDWTITDRIVKFKYKRWWRRSKYRSQSSFMCDSRPPPSDKAHASVNNNSCPKSPFTTSQLRYSLNYSLGVSFRIARSIGGL